MVRYVTKQHDWGSGQANKEVKGSGDNSTAYGTNILAKENSIESYSAGIIHST